MRLFQLHKTLCNLKEKLDRWNTQRWSRFTSYIICLIEYFSSGDKLTLLNYVLNLTILQVPRLGFTYELHLHVIFFFSVYFNFVSLERVWTEFCNAGPVIGSNSDKKGANIANCCICYEQQVDSLLYRYLALIVARSFHLGNLKVRSLEISLGTFVLNFQVWAHVHLFQVCPWIALGHRKMSDMWNPYYRCCPCIYTLMTYRLTGFCSADV